MRQNISARCGRRAGNRVPAIGSSVSVRACWPPSTLAGCERGSRSSILCMCAGIISDVQYADIPDGFSFAKVPRYYRASLTSLSRAVSYWQRSRVDFCIDMGDIVDGFNPPEHADVALDSVIAEFDRLGKRHYHMLGNHCLYNFPRPVSQTYSTITPTVQFRTASNRAPGTLNSDIYTTV